jgi:hypothetical protein
MALPRNTLTLWNVFSMGMCSLRWLCLGIHSHGRRGMRVSAERVPLNGLTLLNR